MPSPTSVLVNIEWRGQHRHRTEDPPCTRLNLLAKLKVKADTRQESRRGRVGGWGVVGSGGYRQR